MIRTFEEAARARVTVYTLSPTGLRRLAGPETAGPEAPVTSAADVLPDERAPVPLRFSAPPRSLAAETGGFSITRPEQFDEGVAQIFRETGSYYLLGYEQPPKKDTGYNMLKGFRAIEVRVNRPGAQVRTHRGYTALPPPAVPKRPAAATTSAIAGILPKPDLPLRVTIAPFAAPGRSEAVVAVTVGIVAPAPDVRELDHLDVQVRAFTQSGDERAMLRQTADVIIPGGRADHTLLEVSGELQLKPGVYAIRAAVHSQRLGLTGSVFTDIEIPDYGSAPIAMSGIVLTSRPRPVAATVAGKPLTVPASTSLRDFTRAHDVSAVLRVYQGGRRPAESVAVRLTILDATGAVVVDNRTDVPADRFARDRSVELRLPVPIHELDAGPHLVRIETSAGSLSVRRDVHLRVR
jgi:hypothetical protein